MRQRLPVASVKVALWPALGRNPVGLWEIGLFVWNVKGPSGWSDT